MRKGWTTVLEQNFAKSAALLSKSCDSLRKFVFCTLFFSLVFGDFISCSENSISIGKFRFSRLSSVLMNGTEVLHSVDRYV